MQAMLFAGEKRYSKIFPGRERTYSIYHDAVRDVRFLFVLTFDLEQDTVGGKNMIE